jgi:L-lactate dehydrogenase complex protein LldF
MPEPGSELLHGARFDPGELAGLAEPRGAQRLAEVVERSARDSAAAAAAVPQWQAWREAAHRIKAHAMARLDTLLVEFEQNATARGATVLWAENAAEANRHVLAIARQHGARSAVKGKSMLSEQMDLNRHLEAAGVRALETDLGEFLVQLAGQRPVHATGPSLHLSRADVAGLFAEKLREPYTLQAEALTAMARRHLREEFLRAGMGITGCNFAAADTGTICLVENEGNIGLATSVPPVHVALVGIEKIVPRLADLPLFLGLLVRSNSSQKLSSYTHLIHGPAPGRRLYVILVDDGRTRVLADRATRAGLYCIRCGGCLNVCPVYRRVGGWVYGWVYPGPIGSVLTPQLIGLKQAGLLPFASTLCGACAEVCPVKVDLAHQLVHLRHRAVREPSPVRAWSDRLAWRAWAWAMSGPRRYRLAMGLVRLFLRVARLLPWHPGALGRWTRGRELPTVPARQAFRAWWRRNRQRESLDRGPHAR